MSDEKQTNSDEIRKCPRCSAPCGDALVNCPICGCCLAIHTSINVQKALSVLNNIENKNNDNGSNTMTITLNNNEIKNNDSEEDTIKVMLNNLDIPFGTVDDSPNDQKKYEAMCHFFEPTDTIASYLSGELIKSHETKQSHNSDIKTIQILNYDEQNSTIPIQEMTLNSNMNPYSYIVSDTDEELLILIEFKPEIDLNNITLYALPKDNDNDDDDMDISPPKLVHVYKTQHLNINFDDIDTLKPDITINCTSKKLEKGQRIKLQKKFKFRKVQYLIIYIKSNQNDTEQTYLNGICFNLSSKIGRVMFSKCDTDKRKEYDKLVKQSKQNVDLNRVRMDNVFQTNEPNQCVCGSGLDCDFIKRITGILRKYHLFLINNTQMDDAKNENVMTIDDMYPNQSYYNKDLINDFNHLLLERDNQFEDVHYHLIAQSNNNTGCNLTKCKAFTRNYRNRLQLFTTLNDHDEKIPDTQCTVTNDIIKEQLLDKIHSYYFHTFDIGCKLTRNDIEGIEQISNDRKDNDNDDADHFIMDQKIMAVSQLIGQRTKSIQHNVVNNKFNTNCKAAVDPKGPSVSMYSFGIKYFYWDYYKDNHSVYDIRQNDGIQTYMRHANDGYTLNQWYIAKKYETLKEEMLQNEVATLSQQDWERLCKAAIDHINSMHGKSFKNTYCMLGMDNISATCYGIKAGDPLTLKHLISIMIYCNFDFLQARFSETFRRIPFNETDQHLKSRHANFVNLARLLRELECFGSHNNNNKLIENECHKLYHGVSVDVMFETVRTQINSPFSTTTDYAVAVNFCQKRGIILELNVDYDWKSRILSPGFSCSWISHYPNEAEWFFIGGSGFFEFKNIIRASLGENYEFYVNALLSICYAYDFGKMTTFIKISKLEKQLIFRLILHELHRYCPKDYHKFKSIPQYIETLLHNHFQTVIQMDVKKSIIKTFDVLLFYDYDWIKLDLLIKMCPKLKRLRLTQYEIKICDSIFISILSFLKKNPNTCLQEISMMGTLDESEMKIQEAIEKYRGSLKSHHWMIWEQESSWGPHLVMESAYSDVMQSYMVEKYNTAIANL